MTRTLIPALVATLLLAACGRTENAPAAESTPVANGPATTTNSAVAPAMSGMGAPATSAAVMAHGSGRVTAIDTAAGTVTIDHGPIPEANWPAMVMAFHARPEVLSGVQVGDTVAFHVTIQGGGGEVTAIRKTP